MTEETETCEPARLSMVVVEVVALGVQQAWKRVWKVWRGGGVGHKLHRKVAEDAMVSKKQQVCEATGIPGGRTQNQGDQQASRESQCR
jgi:hypothetical protein